MAIVTAELLTYKISKLTMMNDITDNGTVQLENIMEFDVKYGQESLAVAVLTEYVRHKLNPNLFWIELELQGLFRVNGIDNAAAKRTMHIKCYDEMFTHADEIMTHLAKNSGMINFSLKKIPINQESVNFGPKPEISTNIGKIVELRTDV